MRDRAMSPLSRRTFLTGLLALGGALPASAQAQAFPQYFSSLSVDVSELKAKGLGPFADLVGAATLDQLRASFADRIDPRGPRLVVRLTSIYQTPFPDGGGGDRWYQGGGGGTDSMNGEALAVGPRGEIIARHPQLAVLAVNRSAIDPDEPGRAVQLAQNYVLWLRRQLIS